MYELEPVSTSTCTVVTMAKTQFLAILLVVTCFLDGVVSVIDKEFEDLVAFVRQQAEMLEEQTMKDEQQSVLITELSITIKQLLETAEQQSTIIQQHSIINEQQTILIQNLKNENKAMTADIKQQEALIMKLSSRANHDVTDGVLNIEQQLAQNETFDERVSLLETQMMVVQDDVTEVDERVELLEGDVNFLFDEQVIQDERIFSLEQTSIETNEEVEDLQDTTLALDFRVATLEVRMETLEGITADHETRISAVEADVNDTIAFHTVLTSYSSISEGSAVLFNEVLLNQGNGYNSETGTFTVPPGGDGYYLFSTYLLGEPAEFGYFDIQINGNTLCTARVEQQQTSNDWLQSSCSAATYAAQGDEVHVVYRSGTDTSPLGVSTNYFWNGFTGFRI